MSEHKGGRVFFGNAPRSGAVELREQRNEARTIERIA
jgi:hypothetical protein